MRKIALSNLSLLPWSLIRGPKWTWEVAQAAGFDALKINPLRGWNGSKLNDLGIPVTAFEAPWRYSLEESWAVLRKGDVRGFVADVFLFGEGADERASWYPACFGSQGAVGIDCPARYDGGFVSVRETDQAKWPTPLDEDTPACLDTWHIRDYRHASRITRTLAETGRIKTIDVQTRESWELLDFLQGKSCPLDRWLLLLATCYLPPEVSVSVEILPPQHLWKLGRALKLDRISVLTCLQKRIRALLP